VRVDYSIREAASADIDTLIAFTLQEAQEAEGKEKELAAVKRGVRGAFEAPPLATYWVAEAPDGRVVASTSVVTEWSNFHGGYYWWIQSLFIMPEHRGKGLIELLLDHISRAAALAGALELRLYARTENERALRAYRRCGFTVAPYTIMTRPQRNDDTRDDLVGRRPNEEL
jgi:GNAT superfamily N-acetyltransferase